MPGWLESFLIALFLAVGKKLAARGLILVEELVAIETKIKKAKEYQKIADKPDNTREERRRAEDDFLS